MHAGGSTPKDLIQRVQNLEQRLLQLESYSPEYSLSQVRVERYTLTWNLHVHIQWNPSIAATVREWYSGCYTEVAVVEGFHCSIFNRDQGCWPLYCRWPLLRGDRYEGFHCIVQCHGSKYEYSNHSYWRGRLSGLHSWWAPELSYWFCSWCECQHPTPTAAACMSVCLWFMIQNVDTPSVKWHSSKTVYY